MKSDLESAHAPSTRKAYRKVKRQFKIFALRHGRRHLPASAKTVGLYITHLRHSAFLKSSSIATHLSAIAYYHSVNGYKNPCKSTLIDSLLLSYKKKDKPPAVRKALTADILEELVTSIRAREVGYCRVLYQTVFIFMYQGLLRSSEVSWSKEAPHNLESRQVTFKKLKSKPHICLAFESYKHSKPNPPPLFMKARPESTILCPVTAFKAYNKLRVKARDRSKDFFFKHSNGKCLLRKDLAEMLKFHLAILGYNPAHYDTHSLRIGKTTDMGKEGYSNSQIALAGRWASKAYEKYLKPEYLVV